MLPAGTEVSQRKVKEPHCLYPLIELFYHLYCFSLGSLIFCQYLIVKHIKISVIHRRGFAILNSILYAQDSICRLLHIFDKWEVVIRVFQEPSVLPVPYCAISPKDIRVVAVPCEDHGLRMWGCFSLTVEGFIHLFLLIRWSKRHATTMSPLWVLSFIWVTFYYFCLLLIFAPFHTGS